MTDGPWSVSYKTQPLVVMSSCDRLSLSVHGIADLLLPNSIQQMLEDAHFD